MGKKKNSDSAAALALMAGLLSGYTQSRYKRKDDERQAAQDKRDEERLRLEQERTQKQDERSKAELDLRTKELEENRKYRQSKDAEEAAYRKATSDRLDRNDVAEQQRFDYSKKLQNWQLKLNSMDKAVDNKRFELQQYKTDNFIDGEPIHPGADAEVKRMQRELGSMQKDLEAFAATDPGSYGEPSTTPRSALSGGTSKPTASLIDSSKPTPYDSLLFSAADEYNIDPHVLKRLMLAESDGNPNAKSPAGASGLMQFMPDTAKQYGIDPLNPGQAIHASAQMMSSLLDQFGGDYAKAVAAYNAGPKTVQDYGGIPPYEETINHVAKILGPEALQGNLSKPMGTTSATQPMSDPSAGPSNDNAAPSGPYITKKDAMEFVRLQSAQLNALQTDYMNAQDGPDKEAIKKQMDVVKNDLAQANAVLRSKYGFSPLAEPQAQPTDDKTANSGGPGLGGMFDSLVKSITSNENYQTPSGDSVDPWGINKDKLALSGMVTPNNNIGGSAYPGMEDSFTKTWQPEIQQQMKRNPDLKWAGYSTDAFRQFYNQAAQTNKGVTPKQAFDQFTKAAEYSLQEGQPGWMRMSSGEVKNDTLPLDLMGLAGIARAGAEYGGSKAMEALGNAFTKRAPAQAERLMLPDMSPSPIPMRAGNMSDQLGWNGVKLSPLRPGETLYGQSELDRALAQMQARPPAPPVAPRPPLALPSPQQMGQAPIPMPGAGQTPSEYFGWQGVKQMPFRPGETTYGQVNPWQDALNALSKNPQWQAIQKMMIEQNSGVRY